MKYELIVQNNVTGKAWEISELVSEVSWSTQLVSQPGCLTFSYIDEKNDVIIPEGSIVSFKVDGQGVFFGMVFKVGTSENKMVAITAYDQLRFLKNKDTYIMSGMTASQFFSKICLDFNLKHNIIDSSSYTLPATVYDNKSIYEMLENTIDLTLINTGSWFCIRDNFGKLEFQLINRLKTLLFIGDQSSLSKYTFDSSIDDDTYNQIKLIKENKETLKREVYIVKDSSTIKSWGTLQYFEKMDENANAAQIQARAEMLLKLKNRKTKSLKLDTVLGDLRVFAGSGVILGIEHLQAFDVAMNKFFMVTRATHTFKNDSHMMSLDLVVSI